MLSFSPTIRLSSVDFPALGFPTTVTIPARVMGLKGRVLGSGSRRLQSTTPPRVIPVVALAHRCRRRPTLPRPLGRSTIGAVGLNDRVRNGNECGPYALVASDVGGDDIGHGGRSRNKLRRATRSVRE